MTTKNSSVRPVRVGLISLGCAKNLADAEIMLGTLLQDGLEITNDASQADVLIVNTCSFIDSAQEESVDAILESAELRERRNPDQALIVSGCLPQRFRDELPRLLPEVDAFIGIDQVAAIPGIVRQALARRAAQAGKERIGHQERRTRRGARASAAPGNREVPAASGEGSVQSPGGPSDSPLLEVHSRPTYIPDYATPRFRLTPHHSAYVKIAEGCNHPCSFCIIPRMRGSHRSRTQSDVVSEAAALVAGGVKELNLISQDSTYYGLDLRPNHRRSISSPEKFGEAVVAMPSEATTICTLLRALDALPGRFWIRLLYTHPAHWTDELIRTIAECPKVARYVDIPLQHIHESMLERMRRETSRRYIEDLLRRIRAGIPGIALRTTFIVGFPGETEGYFQSLLEFIRETRFERLGVFAYSREGGTRAGAMAGQVSDRVKQRRRAEAMAVQRTIAGEVARSFVGRDRTVLVEREVANGDVPAAAVRSWEHGMVRDGAACASPDSHIYRIARSESDAPDIDGRVFVRGRLPVGEFASVKVVGHTDYDLIAVPG